MGVTVTEALRISPLAQGRLVAGAAGLAREIEWIHVIEIFVEPFFLARGQLLLTIGHGLTEDEALQVSVIERAAEAGLAAIVVKTGFFLSEIPVPMQRAADHYGVPLIEIDLQVKFADISQVILGRILHERYVTLQHITAIHKKLMVVGLAPGGLDAIARELHHLMGQTVLIADTDGILLATSGDERHLDLRPGGTLPPHYWQSLLPRINQVAPWRHVCPGDTAAGLPSLLATPILLNQEVQGLIGLIGHRADESFGEVNARALEQASLVAALEWLKAQVKRETERRLEGDLMEAILASVPVEEPILLRRWHYLGFRSCPYYRIVALRLDDLALAGVMAQPSEDRVLALEEQSYRLVVSFYQDHRQAVLVRCIRNMIVVTRGTPVDDEVRERCEAQALCELLAQRLKEYHVAVGVGRAYTRLGELRQSYKEALRALRHARRRDQIGHVNVYNDLGAHRMLLELAESGEAPRYVDEILGSLQQYDQQHASQLITTLQTYLTCDGHQAQTAQRLFVHPNTLVYRLRKIRDLTCRDPARMEDRMAFLLALQLREVLPD